MDDFCVAFCDDEYILTGKTESAIKTAFCDIKSGLKLLTYTDGKKLTDDVKNGVTGIIDILFLDIEMQGMGGIEVKNILEHDRRVRRIVFLTSHPEFAISAFGLKVVKFLKKPVSDKVIINTIKAIEQELRKETVISYKSCGREYAFLLGELLYISAKGKKTILHFLNNGESKITDLSIGDWEKIFKDDIVVRVHKSYMVNLYYVYDFKYSKIFIKEIDTEIPVGRLFTRKTREEIYIFQKSIVKNRNL